jgi:hypothetical protein
MALELTKQVEAVIQAENYFGEFEQRLSNYGALRAYLTNAQALLPAGSIEGIKNAQNVRALSIPTFNKAALTVITTNVCSFTGVEATSAKPQFSSIIRGFAIKTFPKVAANNMLNSEMDQFRTGLINGLRTLAANLDSYAVTQLEANKHTGLAGATALSGVATVANAYQVNLANRDNTYLYIPTLMDLNDMDTGSYNNIMHTIGRALMLKYETNGVNNSQNLAGALNGSLPSASGYRHFTSNRVTNGVGVAETHYLAPFGGIGVFTFVDSDARLSGQKFINNREMYTLTDPIFGIEWAVTAEPVCEDLSATYGAGYERCNGTQYYFSANFGFMNAYSSDTSKPIVKLEVMTS